MTTALTRQEQTDLRTCEAVISKGINTFREVGKALSKIRDAKLYKAEYKSFESYCNTRWGFNRVYAHRLIEAAGVPEVLPNGNKIETEGAARRHLDEQKAAAKAEAKAEPKAEHKPRTVVAEFDFDDDQGPGAEPPRVLPADSDGSDSVGVSEPTAGDIAAEFQRWLQLVVRRHLDSDNGGLTLAIVSNELYFLSEAIIKWEL